MTADRRPDSHQMDVPPELMLCHAVLDTEHFADRVAAAASGGFAALALDLNRRRRHHERGETDDTMLAAASAAGVRIDEIWSLYGVLDHTSRDRTVDRAERLISVARRFGAWMIGAPADFDGRLAPAAALLAEIADRAAEAGLRVGLEPIAFTRLNSVTTAAELIAACERDNVGLIIDIWHTARGRSTITDLDALGDCPIESVQLNDGFFEPCDPDPMVEVARYRPPPGDGEFDVAAIAAAAYRHSPSLRWAVEVASDALHDLEPNAAAASIAPPCRAVLDRIGVR